MAVKKCKCGKDFEDGGFKTLCPSCFAKSMNGNKSNSKDIHRQVFLKVASEQRKGTAEELIKYAKDLEQAYNKWS